MGASLSWFAIRGKAPEAVLRDFGLRKASEAGRRNSSIVGALLPSGWHVISHGRHEFTDEEVARHSQGCEVVACFVEEHVMVSRAAHWKDGREIWTVAHDSQEDLSHLDVRGEPPASFPAVRDRLTKEQEGDGDVDFIFDIPVTLAAEVTGYRYDDRPDVTLEILEAVERPSWFKRLFGG
jgi:hypothetical protein